MEQSQFGKIEKILADSYALDVDDELGFTSFSVFDGNPFLVVEFTDGSGVLEFSQDNNDEVEILSRDPLIFNLRDTYGFLHVIKPLMLTRL
jgi:hypothetical protein